MIFRPDIGIVLSFLIMVLVITLSKRYSQFIHLGLAFLFAIMWQIVAGNEYFYGKNFFIFFGLNIFPLFAWSVGLFIAYMLFFYMYSSIEKKANFKKKLNLRAYLGFILFYWAILILAETLAFHVFGFKNLRGNAYMGLPICNCIHSPPWMQVAYLSIGPLYITTIYFLKSKTPYDVFK